MELIQEGQKLSPKLLLMGLSVACNFLLKLSEAHVRIADGDAQMAFFTAYPLSSLWKEFAPDFSTPFCFVRTKIIDSMQFSHFNTVLHILLFTNNNFVYQIT